MSWTVPVRGRQRRRSSGVHPEGHQGVPAPAAPSASLRAPACGRQSRRCGRRDRARLRGFCCRDITASRPRSGPPHAAGQRQRCGQCAHHDAGKSRGGVPPPHLPAATRCQRRRALSPRVGVTPKRCLHRWRPCRRARRRRGDAHGSAGNPRGGVPPRQLPASPCRAARLARAGPPHAAGADRSRLAASRAGG